MTSHFLLLLSQSLAHNDCDSFDALHNPFTLASDKFSEFIKYGSDSQPCIPTHIVYTEQWKELYILTTVATYIKYDNTLVGCYSYHTNI